MVARFAKVRRVFQKQKTKTRAEDDWIEGKFVLILVLLLLVPILANEYLGDRSGLA